MADSILVRARNLQGALGNLATVDFAAREAILVPSAAEPTRVEWADDDDRPIAEVDDIRWSSDLPVETGIGGGALGWAITESGTEVVSEAPFGARRLLFTSGSGVMASVSLADVTRPLPGPPSAPPIIRGDPAARWRLVLAAERFDTLAGFSARVDEFWTAFTAAEPFKSLAGAGHVGVMGLFWQSDTAIGVFGATDSEHVDRRLWGDNACVVRAVHDAGVRANKILVLINAPYRAGAGGFGDTRPSWTTITSEGAEVWQDVALHELGHAFGLADEYDAAWPGHDEPTVLEPNVSKSPDFHGTDWKLKANADPALVPTCAFGQPFNGPSSTIGTFEGARYEQLGRYRPTPMCRMRVAAAPFCRICADVIIGVVQSV